METFLISTAAVAIAEIGDKTQLLALLLAARYRSFWPIAWGILIATLLNHAAAAWLGALVAGWFSPQALRWAVGASFIAVALWTGIPQADDWAAIWDSPQCRRIRAESAKMEHICQLQQEGGC